MEGAEGERERERERKKEPFFFSLVSFSSFERFSFLLSFALERAPPRATSRAPKARLLRTVVLLLRQVLLVAVLSKQQRKRKTFADLHFYLTLALPCRAQSTNLL